MDEEKLNNIFERIGVKHLEQFLSMAPDDLEEFWDELDDIEPLEEAWFSAQEGLDSVNALLNYFYCHPDVVEDQGDVVSDLTEYQSVLAKLNEREIRWHLAIDY